jgi:hypothetical protein
LNLRKASFFKFIIICKIKLKIDFSDVSLRFYYL